MTRRFTACNLLLAAVVLARLTIDETVVSGVRAAIPSALEHTNAEAQLSLSRPIALATANAVDLQLVPGIGRPLAEEIIENRGHIRKYAAKLPVERKFEAFLLVHGIGWKTAKKLERYIAP